MLSWHTHTVDTLIANVVADCSTVARAPVHRIVPQDTALELPSFIADIVSMDVFMEGLISPPASAASPSSSRLGSSATNSVLPATRQHPLRPGSEKEISLINYIDSKMLRISRRYGKKYTESESSHDDAPGYMSMQEVVADIDPLVDVAWVSGTRMFKPLDSFLSLSYGSMRFLTLLGFMAKAISRLRLSFLRTEIVTSWLMLPTAHLQITYLLSLAGTLLSYLPAFDFSSSTFPLLDKLDLAFVALLRPSTRPSHSQLDAHLSTTDRVRIKSLVEETRVVAVNCASAAGYTASVQDLSLSDDTDEDDDEEQLTEHDASNGDDAIGIALSKIYKRTLEILGDALA
jgi:hypothetical protein